MEGAWSKLLLPVELTSSGRPQLLPGEVECYLLDRADLESDIPLGLPPLKSGFITLTTHRILWLDEHHRNGGAVPLAAISKISPPKKTIKTMFSSPRLKLQVLMTKEGTPSLHGTKTAASSVALSLVLRGQSPPDMFFAKLTELSQTKAWEAARHETTGQPRSYEVAESQSYSVDSSGASRLRPAMAGVSGILKKEQEQWEQADKNLQDAFVDLNALMGKAKEMVILAEKMRARLLAAPGGQSSSMDEEELGSKQEMQDWLLSVGIASPVTKETAGALYHQQLSRQVLLLVLCYPACNAHMQSVPLQKAGGMLALVDAYCMFNRARGTELISPEDLLRACMIWEKIDVPVMLRRFDSGVMVIQSKSQSDEEVFARINSLVVKPENMRVGLSSSDAARGLGMAPALAKEQLLAAEKKGYLCRDDGPEGLRFFLNFFKDVEAGSFSS